MCQASSHYLFFMLNTHEYWCAFWNIHQVNVNMYVEAHSKCFQHKILEYFVCASPFENKAHHFGFNRTEPNRYLGLLKNNLDFPRIEFYAFHLLSIGLSLFFFSLLPNYNSLAKPNHIQMNIQAPGKKAIH